METANLDLYVIAFGRPDLLWQQKRLLDKHLDESYTLNVVDNSTSEAGIRHACDDLGLPYIKSPSLKGEHHEALNFAASLVTQRQPEFFGFLDHDVVPRRHTSIISKVQGPGFYGIGQTHSPTGRQYLWPGFCFFSRDWISGRPLDFGGIRTGIKRDDGDTGSAMWQLFSDADWRDLYGMEHGYVALRQPDSYGLQSWGYELLGDWVHLTNSSHWMDVPNPDERDRLALEYLNSL